MVATIGKAGLRVAAIGTGVAVDKMLALTGQMPTVQIANIVMPSAEEPAKIDACTANLTVSRGGLGRHLIRQRSARTTLRAAAQSLSFKRVTVT
jgi:hypothetical protein